MRGSSQQENMTCLALNTVVTNLLNCMKVLPYLLNDTSENDLIKIGYSEKIRDFWISAEGWCCFFTESSRHSRGLLGSCLRQVVTVRAWVTCERTLLLRELNAWNSLCHISNSWRRISAQQPGPRNTITQVVDCRGQARALLVPKDTGSTWSRVRTAASWHVC